MKFKHLHVENIRSYETLDLDFPDGVTVISGVNGSGKSSILEACFMGIFGGEVLRGTALQIPDMIRKDSSKACIILDFEHSGDDYQIEQHYRATKTGGASNSKSILRKNGEIIAEQSKNTYEAIQKLLNMDEKNFQNCAYIRQGDVDALINAKPKDRQQMIDDLLRLGKLEEYRERAHNSKTAVSRVLRSENEKQTITQDKIAQLRAKNLHAELNRRQEVIEKINAAVAKKNEEKDKLSSDLTLLDAQIKEIEKDKTEIETLKKESAELGQQCDTEISRRENSLQEILSTEKKIAEITLAAGQLRSDINGFKNRDEASVLNPDFPSLRISDDDANIELVSSAARAEESRALEAKHAVSKESEVIGVRKDNAEKEIRQKEKELSEIKINLNELKKRIENQISIVSKANAAVEGGLSNAETEKAAFLKLFDDLYAALEKESQSNPIEKESEACDEKCISGICDISFYSNVIKIEDLPKPSDEESWRRMIDDIEKLEEYILERVRCEESRLTEEEKKKALIKGELDEKEKSIEETDKDSRRLDEDKEKAALELKNESAEFEKKKKLISDYTALLEMHNSKRNEKLTAAVILKETVPPSRYQLNDILPKDVTDAHEQLSAKKETYVAEIASLESRDKEIQKSILKKEELLKAGKCPTCGQIIKADGGGSSSDGSSNSVGSSGDGSNSGDGGSSGNGGSSGDGSSNSGGDNSGTHSHGTGEEVKQREEIAARLKELLVLKTESESQMSILKEISQIDEKIEQIKAEMNTFHAEEKGKAEMIEKFKKDLEDIDKQKAALNARKLEHSVFCEARRKDLAKTEERLKELQAESDKRREKSDLLSGREKSFSEAVNSILLGYKTLEAESNMSAESQKRLEEVEKQKEAVEKNISELRTEADKINAEMIQVKAKVEQANKIYALITDVRAKIEQLADFGKEKDKLKAVLDGRKTTMAEQDKSVSHYKKQISEKEVKIKELNEKIKIIIDKFEDGSIGGDNGNERAGGDNSGDNSGFSFESKKEQLLAQIRAVTESVAEFDLNRTNILEETGKLRNELSVLSDYEKESGILRNKLLFLSFVSEDVTALEEMYLRIRADLRAKNIEALDQLLNEMFDFIYSNNAYSHLELDSDYNLKVHEKDGSVLEPKQLSGGERAIFNLALRCAIYRLLSLGFGENSAGKTSLPPLIFDEPTVFLDSGHVRQLIKLIEHMREDGVGQIIVVSHDESLIDSADVNFKIEKNPLTNASAVVE
ncbi:Chromosome partition protein Smc [Methanimicrococcus hongohii]|uniref:Chromosome partition protein Smc n=1 Tax=Methanimicrococcus hongohii TaxID=3028295 RepID=A0AA96ZU49_9EURY|nr:AAA family ATPase [Methanimicrococcus sp. Hf6]WNY23437.1 Chromosome partition protein Smc [Methanimicrococcus sp. Hf6]